MTQPRFAPIPIEDEVRPTYRLETTRPWVASRPADLRGPRTAGGGRGVPGPDQGYALRLARRLADEVQLGPGEHLEDALVAGVVVALRRAALFGRAPVLGDVELGLGLFGFLGTGDGSSVPEDLVRERRRLLAGAGHDYREQRDLADLVPDATLRCRPEEVRSALGRWRELLGL